MEQYMMWKRSHGEEFWSDKSSLRRVRVSARKAVGEVVNGSDPVRIQYIDKGTRSITQQAQLSDISASTGSCVTPPNDVRQDKIGISSGYLMRDSTIRKRKGSCSTAVNSEDEVDWNTDEVYLGNRKETVGHIIKKAAVEPLPTMELTYSAERRIMALGMSSILDLIDLSDEGQLKTLFNEEEQDLLKEKYKYLQEYDPQISYISDELRMHLDLLAISLSKSQLQGARSYVLRQILSSNDEMSRNLNVIQHVVETHIFYEHILSSSSTGRKDVDISELDYLSDVWKPLFSRLLMGSAAKIRNKGGETTMPYSNEEKRLMYDDNATVAFKVDCRILIDYEREEHDLAVIEVAKNTTKGKIFSDCAKLLREANSITNMLAEIVKDDEQFLSNTTAYAIQIGGLSGAIYSIHLVAPTLYVAVFEASIEFPASPSSLNKIRPTLNALFWLRDKLNQRGVVVQSELAKIKPIKEVFGASSQVPEQPAGPSRNAWINGSFYTPPKGKKFKTLQDLVKPSTPNLVGTFMDIMATEKTLNFPEVEFNEDGWGRVFHDGVFQWYNLHLNEFSNTYGGKSAD
ncbi:hypothetical protein BGX21_002450 [Mortierella sp. AD011]|nr:hypothetical protein BGX21_002450 [Mortierella sp. AD011]